MNLPFVRLLIKWVVLLTTCYSAVGEVPRVDVLFAYTPAVKAQHNGHAGVVAYAYSLIEGTNLAYQESGVDLTVHAVHVVEVDYVEQGDSVDLVAIRNPSDGKMDEVHALRNAYGADAVCLLVMNRGSGIAYLLSNQSGSSAYAFSVVGASGSGFGLFAHELGHNLGCAHDHDNSTNAGLFDYSHGHRFNGTNGVQYRTIMAYSPGNWIMRFSNPDKLYQGQATGVAAGNDKAADNVSTINFSGSVVAGYRVAVPVSPRIDAEPQDLTALVGTELVLQTLVRGAPPLSVQWYEGQQGNVSKPVGDLMGQGLQLTVKAGDFHYWARVQNDDGSVDTRAARVRGITSWSGVASLDQQQTSGNTYWGNPSLTRSWQDVVFQQTYLDRIELQMIKIGNPTSFGFRLLDGNDLPIIERTIVDHAGAWISIPIGISVVAGQRYRMEVVPGDSSTDYFSWLGTGSGNPYPQGASSDSETWDFSFRTYGGSLEVTTVATPTFSPDGGIHSGSVEVTIASATAGATIRYTTNGSEPTASSTLLPQSGMVTISSTGTLKAKAFKSGMSDSATKSASYTITSGPVPIDWKTTLASAKEAVGDSGKLILLLAGRDTCGNTQWMKNTVMEMESIRQVIDANYVCWYCPVDTSTEWYAYASGLGSFTLPLICVIDPDNSSEYLDRTTSIQSAAAFETRLKSHVSTTPVTATPAFEPDGGTYTGSVEVTLTCATDGATIRYTTNGTEPTASSTLLPQSGKVTISISGTLKAKAFKAGMSDSETKSAAYVIEVPAIANPTVSSLWRVDNAQAGSKVALWAEVQNQGNAAMPAGSVVRFWVSGQEWVGQASVAGLAAGTKTWYKLDWTVPATATAGTLKYWAIVQDASGKNLSSWSKEQSFAVAAGAPKPVVTSLWKVDNAAVGATVPLWAEVENQGDAQLPVGADVKFWVSGQSDPWVGSAAIGALAVGQKKWLKLDWTIPSTSKTGAQKYWAIVHDSAGMELSGWSADQAFSIAAAAAQAEARVTQLWRVDGSLAGSGADLWAEVENPGSIPLPAGSAVKFWVSGQSNPWVGQTSVSGLASGQKQWYKFYWIIPENTALGNQNYWAIVQDADGKDLSKWSAARSFTITSPYIATITSLWPVSGAKPGAKVVLWAWVRNDSSTALPSDAVVRFNVNGITNPWVGDVSVAGLGAGASRWYSHEWTIPVSVTPGNHIYGAIIQSSSGGGHVSKWSTVQQFVVAQ